MSYVVDYYILLLFIKAFMFDVLAVVCVNQDAKCFPKLFIIQT
jgi:hypothetical protein